MSVALILSFLGVVMLVYVVPGADWLLIAKASIRSRRDGLIASFGIQTGIVIHGTLAVVGLSALIASSPVALTVIQVLGAIYICYLGARGIVTSRTAQGLRIEGEEDRTTLRLYRDCTVANLLNPKAVLFFVSVLPQFLDKDGNIPLQVALLTIVDIAIGLLWWVLLVLMVRRLVTTLESDTASRRLNLVSSIALVLVGVALLVYTGIEIL